MSEKIGAFVGNILIDYVHIPFYVQSVFKYCKIIQSLNLHSLVYSWLPLSYKVLSRNFLNLLCLIQSGKIHSQKQQAAVTRNLVKDEAGDWLHVKSSFMARLWILILRAEGRGAYL